MQLEKLETQTVSLKKEFHPLKFVFQLRTCNSFPFHTKPFMPRDFNPEEQHIILIVNL